MTGPGEDVVVAAGQFGDDRVADTALSDEAWLKGPIAGMIEAYATKSWIVKGAPRPNSPAVIQHRHVRVATHQRRRPHTAAARPKTIQATRHPPLLLCIFDS